MDGRAAVGGGHGPKFVVLGEEGREVEGMVDPFNTFQIDS